MESAALAVILMDRILQRDESTNSVRDLDADIPYLHIVPLLSCGFGTPGAMPTLDSGLYQQLKKGNPIPYTLDQVIQRQR